MTFDFSFTENLKKIEIGKYALSTKSNYQSKIEIKEGFNFIDKRAAGFDFIPFMFFTKENYKITSSEGILGTFTIVVPHKIELKISLFVNLYAKIGNDIDSDKIILDSFKEYDPLIIKDPIDFINEKQKSTNISFDSFELSSSYELEKIDIKKIQTQLITYNENRDYILNSFKNSDNNSILKIAKKPNGDSLSIGEYLSNKNIRVEKIANERIGDDEIYDEIIFDYYPENNKTVYEGNNISNIEALIKSQNKNLDCPNLEDPKNRMQFDIFEIKDYPEYKVVWIWKMVTIGCLKTILFLPVLKRQLNIKKLIAYVSIIKLNEIESLIKSQVENCTINAAKEAVVLALYNNDIEQAINLFRMSLQKCIKINIYNNINCLNAGLFILTEEGEWEEFKWL